jgi:hypothetical protein
LLDLQAGGLFCFYQNKSEHKIRKSNLDELD